MTFPVVFGEVLYDCFPDGSKILGGAPFNVAWHCHAFGLEPLFISRIGDDVDGHTIRTAMLEWGMNIDGLQIDSEHPTGVVNVSFTENEPSYDIVENSAWDFIDSQNIPEIKDNSLLYHGSLALRNSVSATCLDMINKTTSSSVFVDVNLRSPWWDLTNVYKFIQGSQWLKINADEVDLILSDKGNLEDKAYYLLDKLKLKYIVVTQGSSGAFALTRDAMYTVKPEDSITVIDTVGAGDAFTSILILGLHKSWPLDITIQRAQQFASQVVGLRGATTQDKNFYKPFVKDWSL
jgi:fructokinase